MNQDILNQVYRLVDELKNKEHYIKLKQLEKELETPEIKTLIDEYVKVKKRYQEVTKYGKHHPDLTKTKLAFSQIKEQLFTQDVIKQYKENEKKIQRDLNTVSEKLAKAISHKIKYPNELGLLNRH
ncbi:MAG: YlbF family regulator [Candidatus Izimaplasma sp.]|nr:YlbF family regulator [Candidatus Izimaplasma bacterium]